MGGFFGVHLFLAHEMMPLLKVVAVFRIRKYLSRIRIRGYIIQIQEGQFITDSEDLLRIKTLVVG
jgi:hypothetical protein